MFSLSSLGFDPQSIKSLLVSYFIVVLFSGILAVLFWVLNAVGIYDMSERFGISNKWYAFVPFLRDYAFGNLAAKASNKNKNSAKLLVALKVIAAVIFVFSFVTFLVTAVDVVFKADAAMLNDTEIDSQAIAKLVLPAILLLVASVVFVIYFIVRCVCAYRIFDAFSSSAVLLLVLSVIFPVLTPIFLFAIRENKPKALE